MRTWKITGIISAFVILISATALPAADSAPPASAPEATGQAVMEYLTKVSPYQQWPLVPGTTAFREGQEPHGQLQNVHANAIAMKGFEAKANPMPEGTMIVKETYTRDKKLQTINVMYKKTGFNPEAGDYFWARFSPDWKVMAEGKIAGCIRCHTPAKDTKDFIILSPIK